MNGKIVKHVSRNFRNMSTKIKNMPRIFKIYLECKKKNSEKCQENANTNKRQKC